MDLQCRTTRMRSRSLPTLLFPCALAACGANEAPVLEPIADQSVGANSELTLHLRATDDDGDPLPFAFDATLPGVKERAILQPLGDEEAIFRWTPFVSDIGDHTFEFSVSDGEATTREA